MPKKTTNKISKVKPAPSIEEVEKPIESIELIALNLVKPKEDLQISYQSLLKQIILPLVNYGRQNNESIDLTKMPKNELFVENKASAAVVEQDARYYHMLLAQYETEAKALEMAGPMFEMAKAGYEASLLKSLSTRGLVAYGAEISYQLGMIPNTLRDELTQQAVYGELAIQIANRKKKAKTLARTALATKMGMSLKAYDKYMAEAEIRAKLLAEAKADTSITPKEE